MEYKVVYKGGSGEIIEKKSKFIATVFPIQSEEEALNYIEQIKKRYYNASHNCYAYVLGRNYELTRCSDDGEPSKTAGKPILDILLLEEIHNALIIVTRYFGGTLLGTGGLVRAYQSAAKEGLNQCDIIEKKLSGKYSIITDYNGIGKLQYIAGQMKLTILDTIYTDIVTVYMLISKESEELFSKKIKEVTGGKTKIEKLCDLYFAIYQNEVLIFS